MGLQLQFNPTLTSYRFDRIGLISLSKSLLGLFACSCLLVVVAINEVQ